jgi:hypothetical protein
LRDTSVALARISWSRRCFPRFPLLQYVAALPQDGPLFPGLVRRASKGGKIGARLGELFRDKLEALGLKRDQPPVAPRCF